MIPVVVVLYFVILEMTHTSYGVWDVVVLALVIWYAVALGLRHRKAAEARNRANDEPKPPSA